MRRTRSSSSGAVSGPGVGEVEGRQGHAALGRLAEDGVEPGVAVLDVEDRVVERLLLGQLEVEVERRVGAAGEEEVAGGVAAHLLDHLAQPDHVAGPLAHLHGLAAAGQVDHLDEHHVQVVARVAERLHGRLEPRHVAAVVGAQHVDEQVGPLALLPVVGDVGAEVGGRAVGLLDRAVHLVAVAGGAEERELIGGADPLLVRPGRRRRARRALLRLGRRQLARRRRGRGASRSSMNRSTAPDS